MSELWDTNKLFQALLEDFETSLNSARYLRTTELENSLALKAAIIGFGQFVPVPEWSRQHLEFIADRLQGEFSLQELAWYGECAEAISVFACLALGALLGKYQSGEIDDFGFTLGDAHLAGFISLHNDKICALFSP